MYKQKFREWKKELADAPDLYLILGILISVQFAIAVGFLFVEWLGVGQDIFPGSTLILPWALGFSGVSLVGGIVVLFLGLRRLSFPGSFFYNLTHFKFRKR